MHWRNVKVLKFGIYTPVAFLSRSHFRNTEIRHLTLYETYILAYSYRAQLVRINLEKKNNFLFMKG